MAKDNNNSKRNKPRAPKEGANPKKFKKKTSVLVTDKVEYIDYKDVNLLTRFVILTDLPSGMPSSSAS